MAGVRSARTTTGNQIKFAMIRIPYSITVHTLCTLLNTTSGGAVAGFAIYDVTGQIKKLAWDNINIASSGLKTTTLSVTVTLPSGIYCAASACSNTSSAASQCGYQGGSTSEGIEPWSANGTKRSGTTSNPMVGGVMPDSLGTFSLGGGGFTTLPYILMEP
jgi:hypothetical protein